MFRKLSVIVVLCLGALTLSAQVTPPAAEDPNTYFKPVRWRSIGPFRGGRAVAGTGVVGDPTTYYMGTTGGGLWKTDNMGVTWRNVSDGYFKTGSVGAIAVAESDPNVVYVGMGEHAVRGVMTHHGDGVYRSTDAGKTWKRVGLELTQHISRIVVHPKDPDTVLVAAQGALYSASEERGHLQVDRRRGDLEEGPVRERQDRRRGTVDGRDEPADPLRGDVGTRPPALAGDQRRCRQRPVQVHRHRRHLAEDDRGAARADGQDGDRRQPLEPGKGVRPDRERLGQGRTRAVCLDELGQDLDPGDQRAAAGAAGLVLHGTLHRPEGRAHDLRAERARAAIEGRGQDLGDVVGHAR